MVFSDECRYDLGPLRHDHVSPISQLHFKGSKLVGGIVYFCRRGYTWGKPLDPPLQRSWLSGASFKRCLSLYSREGGHRSGRHWEGPPSPGGPRDRGHSPVTAEPGGGFLRPRFGSNHDAPWASAGLRLAETVPCFCAQVRRMRETDRQPGQGLRDWDPCLRTSPGGPGGQSAQS